MTKKETIKHIIYELGGYDDCASRFNCTTSALRLWESSGIIPDARLRHIKDIRPDLFSLYEEQKEAA